MNVRDGEELSVAQGDLQMLWAAFPEMPTKYTSIGRSSRNR
ncbi:MAG: hypothetical protein V8R80_01800 [Eubacterium sp.]